MAHPHVLHTIWLDSREPTNTDTLWIKPLPKGQYGAFVYGQNGWIMTTALFKGTLGEFVVNDLPEATEDSNGVMSYMDKRALDSLDLEAVRLGDLVKNIFEKKVNYLKDKDGYIIFPVTHEDAVIDTQGKTLTEKLADKQDTLESGINIKTINNQSILGGGNITIDTSVEPQVSLSWSELKELQNSGELVPGCVYRITDYVATTTDVNTRSANHPFDIITKAIDECNLSEECLAALHHGDTYFANSNLAAWKIWYRLDNDTATFDWADPMNGKGVIYRMIDEFGNDIGYDFKGIQLARYRVTPAIGYENVLSSISGMWLGRNHSFTPMGLDVDISEVKWFYTFSYLTNGWDNAEDASIVSNGGCYGNIIPLALLRGSSRYINNNVFLNGQFPVDTLKAIDSGAMTILNSCNFVANADCSRNTFFGGGCNTVADSQFRDNIFFGPFRHNVVGTDVERNTVVAYHDIAANRMNMYKNVISSSRFTSTRTDQTFHDNTFNVTGEFTGCSFNGFSTDNNVTCGGNIAWCTAEYFNNNNLNVSGNITNNLFGPNFKANTATITGGISNVTFSKQVNNNTFLSDLVGCNFDGIVSYVTIPAVSGKRFANCDVRGGVRGTSSSSFSLDYQGFFLSGVTGITRRVSIEGTVDSKVVATWKDNGVIKGVMKAPGGTWESIPDIDDKQDVLVSGTNIKTVNNQSLLGPGDIEITPGTQSDWNQNDDTATDYIKNRTHYTKREITTNIPDAKLSWSGSTFEDIDFWFYGTNVHIPYNGHEGWELSWDDGSIFINYLGFGFEIGVLKDGEWEYTPFDPSYDQQPYPLGVDVVVSTDVVYKLDNKYLDLDSTPVINSFKPITSDGVRRALNDIPSQEQSDWNETSVSDPAYIKNKPNDLVHYTDVGQSEPINVPDYATEEEVSQLRSDVDDVEHPIYGTATSFSLSGAGVSPYKFHAGFTYTIWNDGNSSAGFSTRQTESGSTIDGVFTIAAGNSHTFVASQDANYLRMNAAATGRITVKTMQSEIDDAETEISAIQAELNLFSIHFGLAKNGELRTGVTGFLTTPLIPVIEGETVKVKGYSGGETYNYSLLCFYDEDKTFLSAHGNSTQGLSEITMAVPANAAYMRCGSRDTVIDSSYIRCNFLSKVLGLFEIDSARIDENKEDISEIQPVIQFPPNKFVFNGTDSSVKITPITLSQNGDSLEVGIIMGKNYTSIVYGYPFTQGGATNGIGLALSATAVSLRSDDGNWLVSSAVFSNYVDDDGTNKSYTFIVKYEDNIINCYVNGNLVATYSGQKTITIYSVGDGALYGGTTRPYGYWAGTVTKFLYTHNGVTKSLSNLPGYDTHNITTETLRENILAEVDGDSNSIAAKIRPMPYFAGQAPSSFISKILASNKDIEILLSGDSVTGFSHVANAIIGAENLPAGCQYDSLTYQLWNGLCTNKQQCDRYDSRVNSFTETGTWVLVDPKKLNNAVSGGPSSNRNKGEFSQANSVFRQGSTDASVSFSFDTDAYEKMNIVHLKGLDGTTEATISCVSGKLEVYDRATGQWVEANGYTFSQSTLIDGAVPGDSNIHSHWVRNVALKFRKASGATGSVTVTVTNTGTGYLYYWGTERWSGNTVRIVNCGKGGRTTSLLQRTINDDIVERDVDLVIWQVPLWNEMKAGGAYNTNYDPSHTIFLDTLKTLSDNFADFQVIVWYPHTQVADWVGDKNLQFQANGLVDRPKTDLTSCEHINKSQAAIISYDSAVKVVNLGILAKDFANSIGYTMQEILYTDGSGEDIGDGTESGDIDKSGRFTVDGTHLSTSGCKFFTELLIPMLRV